MAQRRTVQWLIAFVVALIVASCGGRAATNTPAPAPATALAPSATAAAAAAPTATTAAASTATSAPAASPTRAASPATTAASPAAGAFGATALQPCSAASKLRTAGTPIPASPAAAPTATATRAGPPPPTSTPRPAPQADRVGFPEGYQDSFKLMFIFDRPDNKQVRVICGNDKAVVVKPGQPFPYGSVMVMETYRTVQDAKGVPIKDASGRFVRESLTGIFVQRKEQGFGVDYQDDRSGEWEYVAFRPDKSYSSPPQNTNACASCHLKQAGPGQDFAFRMDLFFNGEQALAPPKAADNEVDIFIYDFMPMTLTVKVGTTVKWINNDEAEHTIVAKDGTFVSDALKTKDIKPGDSFSFTFEKEGTFEYECSIHPAMKAKIVVTK